MTYDGKVGALGIISKLVRSPNKDEVHARQLFVESHRAQLPDDLCPCIDDVPPHYAIDVVDGDTQEELPDIDEDLLEDVCGPLF